jgi:hypothetical protein
LELATLPPDTNKITNRGSRQFTHRIVPVHLHRDLTEAEAEGDQAAEQIVEATWKRIGTLPTCITLQQCANDFATAGYAST